MSDAALAEEMAAHRAGMIPETCAESLRFAFAARPSVEQARWEAFLAQTDAAAQVLIERDPTNRAALAWRADRRARLTAERERIFRLHRTQDTHIAVITNIGGTN